MVTTVDDARRARTNMAISSNGSNAKRVRTNKVAIIDEGGTRRVCVNILAIAYAIVMTRKKANANIVATTNKPAKKRADSNIRRADTNVVAEKRADAKKSVTNKELKKTFRELVIYKNNKRSIGFTKSFERPAQNKYSLQARSAIIIKSQIYMSKKTKILVEQ